MTGDAMAKINQVQNKCAQLLGEMKKQERELQKQKKRADTLQKEKDAAKSELNKATSMKEKLEKLSRETSNENRKLRVYALRVYVRRQFANATMTGRHQPPPRN